MIHAFKNGRWKQNCYLLCDDANECVVIDPGGDGPGLLALIERLNVRPIAIVNTHAHYDHIGAVVDLTDRFSMSFFLHPREEALMKRANLYKLLFENSRSIRIPGAFVPLREESGPLVVNGFEFNLFETPGHTPGSICLRWKDALFTGDTLLPAGPGTTTLPGGDRASLEASLDRLRGLPGDLTVYPGHGSPFLLDSVLRS